MEAGDVAAVRRLAAHQLRGRWRSVVALTLLVGIVGAVVLATVAGARRSDTALARFNAASRSGDVALLGAFGYTPTPAQLSALRHVHDVEAVAMIRFYALQGSGPLAKGGVAAAVDDAMGNTVERSRLVAGRRANPSAPGEVTIGESLAALLHQGVGGHLDAASYTPAQVQGAAGGGGTPPAPGGPPVRLRIVGIVRRPSDLGDLGAAGSASGLIVLTPAFDRANFDRIGNLGVLLDVRTRHGAADVPSVVQEARHIFATSGGVSTTDGLNNSGDAQSAIDVLTLTLWVFAGVTALAGIVTIGIVLTRETSRASADRETLRALGLTRRQRVLTNGPRALLVAGGGAIVSVVVAGGASPLFPVGVARRADPDPGLHFDWVVLGLGAAAIALAVMVIALFAALRSNPRAAPAAADEGPRRTSSLVEAAARAGLAPSATSGLRMALEPGRGRTAVPVRSAYLGATFGVLGLVAVLVFATSLDHLVATPRLYGWNWDFSSSDVNFQNRCGRADFGLVREPGVTSVAAVCTNDVQLGGRPVTGFGFTELRGGIEPDVVAGRAPRNAREVALGSVTLHALGKSVGDTVTGRGPHRSVAYRVVGRAVFPGLGDQQPLADGAAFTGPGLSAIFDSNTSSARYLVGDYGPGANRVVIARHIGALPGLAPPAGSTVPPEVTRLRHIGWLPATLAALLGGLALVAVGHALVTAVRRRRRDLGLLKTLGFNRRQVGATIAWQATTLGAVGLLVGIPAGLALGGIIWRLVAEGLGVSATASIPALAVLLAIPTVLVLVNLIAYFPARSAGRTRPAVALRAE
jgi:hypothetical protein